MRKSDYGLFLSIRDLSEAVWLLGGRLVSIGFVDCGSLVLGLFGVFKRFTLVSNGSH